MADGDAADEFGRDEDTIVDLDPSDLKEIDERTPPPTVNAELLEAYERGRRDERLEVFQKWDALLAAQRRQGAADILAALRRRLVKAGETPDGAARIAAVVAQMASYKTH